MHRGQKLARGQGKMRIENLKGLLPLKRSWLGLLMPPLRVNFLNFLITLYLQITTRKWPSRYLFLPPTCSIVYQPASSRSSCSLCCYLLEHLHHHHHMSIVHKFLFVCLFFKFFIQRMNKQTICSVSHTFIYLWRPDTISTLSPTNRFSICRVPHPVQSLRQCSSE